MPPAPRRQQDDDRVPEVLMPKRIVLHVRKMLGIPTYSFIRYPVQGLRYVVNYERIA